MRPIGRVRRIRPDHRDRDLSNLTGRGEDASRNDATPIGSGRGPTRKLKIVQQDRDRLTIVQRRHSSHSFTSQPRSPRRTFTMRRIISGRLGASSSRMRTSSIAEIVLRWSRTTTARFPQAEDPAPLCLSTRRTFGSITCAIDGAAFHNEGLAEVASSCGAALDAAEDAAMDAWCRA